MATSRPTPPRTSTSAHRLTVGRVLLYVAALMLAWIGAWLLHSAASLSPQQGGWTPFPGPSPSLTQPAAMLGVMLVGLGAGLAKQRSGSLWGSILVHAVNNLYSAFLR